MKPAASRIWLVLPAAAGAAIILGFFHLAAQTRVEPEHLRLEPCRVYFDRRGEMLRFVPDENGERHLEASLGKIPPLVRKAFISAEDERFYRHPGVDPAAVMRALLDNLREGRIVSGASTITQQLCRLAYPRKRTYYSKFLEAVRSLRIEAAMGKDEILGLYLNRVPLGNNLLGVEAAARVYFGKSSESLTAAEAALLASLPKAPGLLNPYGKNRNRLERRKDWVLDRMGRLGHLGEKELREARKEEILLRPRQFPMEAPHLVDTLLQRDSDDNPGPVTTAIDLELQKSVEDILISHRRRLKFRGASQAAAVVMSNKKAEVLALAGSLEYSSRDKGFNNGALALRSPGSTLKPFLYALALDSGFTAAGTLEDVGRKYRFPHGEYLPENFNRESYGPVSLREALGNSLNLSAVNLLNLIGYGTFYQSLTGIGLINYPDRGPDYYGLGMVVGNPEVSLVQLASGYASLANGGLYRPAQFILEEEETEGRPVFSAQAGYIISRILSDPAARSVAFAGSLAMNSLPGTALKTGTSTRYRDCWTLGYTPEHTVGVWVGNFEGRPTWNMTGASAAAPIFADIMKKLYPLGDPPPFQAPESVSTAGVCSYSGMKPTEGCSHVREEIFIKGTEPAEPCTYHRIDRNVHELSTRFAGWLHDRYQRGTEGKYRLAGFGHDLDLVFNDPGAGPESAAGREIIRGRVTIGKEPVAARPSPGDRVSIIYPLDGDHYLMERGKMEQVVALKAVCDGPAKEISWYVDGVEYASTGPPYELKGRLSRGRHLISAVGPSATGDSVEVSIE